MPTPDFIACSGPRPLPAHQLLAAADLAWEHNPANYPMVGHIALIAPGVDMPQAIAVLTTKYWGSAQRTLKVSFLEKTTADLSDKILAHMNAWAEKGCGIAFDRAAAGKRGDVRISRDTDGYWSYLGTDLRMIPSGEPTMSLQGFSLDTPTSEYKRVVRHEVGHSLGFPHEHMRKSLVDRLDPAKTVAAFARDYGWTREMVVQQVLTPLDERSLLGTPADKTSIMSYQFAADLTRDGKGIPGGLDINKADAAFAKRIYPKAGP